jgi:gamma-aminobutyric acid receptor subunit beta
MKNYIRTFFFTLFICIILFGSLNAQIDIPRPNAESGSTKVNVTVIVLNINEINAATQSLTANIFIILNWKDSRLAHTGPQKIIKPMKDIWNPQLIIVNRQSVTFTLPDNCEIYPDGTVKYKQRVFGSFSQTLNYKDFPFDKQKFEINIASTEYGPGDVEFITDSTKKSVIEENISLMDWTVLEWNNIDRPYSISSDIPPVSSFTFQFIAERKSMYYIFNFIFPLILIILMSMSVYWLDAKMASSQISIAITSMLTLIAYRFMIMGALPKISYLTRMDIFIFCSTILIFITLVEALLTAVFVAKGKEALANNIDFHSRWIFILIYVFVFIVAFVI